MYYVPWVNGFHIFTINVYPDNCSIVFFLFVHPELWSDFRKSIQLDTVSSWESIKPLNRSLVPSACFHQSCFSDEDFKSKHTFFFWLVSESNWLPREPSVCKPGRHTATTGAIYSTLLWWTQSSQWHLLPNIVTSIFQISKKSLVLKSRGWV